MKVEPDELKAKVRRLVEGLNARDAAVIDATYAPEYVGHDPDRPKARTIDDLRAVFAQFLTSVVPDGRYTIEHLVVEGDLALWHWTFSGTHRGEFMGVVPTGKTFSFGGVNLFRFQDGKVVEDWVYRDTVGFMRQLGLLPAPAAPSPPPGASR